MSATRPFVLRSDAGANLHGVLHPANRHGRRPTVVVCHGFKGFMDWGFLPPLATLLAERGCTVVRFNYSGTGQNPGDDQVTNLDAFRANTHSQEVAETLSVLRALGDTLGEDCVDPERVGLVGHSRGGGAAILAAAHDAARDAVRALVTWAAVATFDRYDDAVKDRWRADGALPIVNGRTGQTLPLGIGLLEDIEQHAAALDLLSAAARRQAPWLIVHGDADETVPFAEAQRLAEHADGTHELLSIAAGGHTFGAQHPFHGPTPELIRVMNATQSWLRRHL